jgi:hypothetical protein
LPACERSDQNNNKGEKYQQQKRQKRQKRRNERTEQKSLKQISSSTLQEKQATLSLESVNINNTDRKVLPIDDDIDSDFYYSAKILCAKFVLL